MNDFRNITLEEASQFINALPDPEMREAMQTHLDAFAEFVEDESSKIILYEGDVTLSYLAIKDDIVIVNGNLTVTGILEDALEVNISLMLALGNVTVQNLFTFSQICIAGNLIVQNAIIADSTYDYSLHVGGDLKATLIIEYHHSFYIQGKVTAGFMYTTHAAAPRGPLQPNLKDEDFIDAVITKDELDLDKALRKIMRSESVIKNTN
ncbi:hypothetical protein [Chitinophaga sp. CF418]|uniref:hypothetical protein n=1 Tax=Chitinophaga sp. CF418 TaxID=1855287 RepID=UPI00091F83BA|nr:hypothetical protein [Chitinophaga sp. CF418]SHN36067.1 hypothetical protein SAMN05216311_11053 [Chitinophaga sp. CF418]